MTIEYPWHPLHGRRLRVHEGARRSGSDVLQEVRVAVRGSSDRLSLTQEGEPVLAHHGVAVHVGSVQQLHGVEIEVAETRLRIRVDQHVVGRRIERTGRVVGGCSRPHVCEKGARRQLLRAEARVVELDDALAGEGAQVRVEEG